MIERSFSTNEKNPFFSSTLDVKRLQWGLNDSVGKDDIQQFLLEKLTFSKGKG